MNNVCVVFRLVVLGEVFFVVIYVIDVMVELCVKVFYWFVLEYYSLIIYCFVLFLDSFEV